LSEKYKNAPIDINILYKNQSLVIAENNIRAENLLFRSTHPTMVNLNRHVSEYFLYSAATDCSVNVGISWLLFTDDYLASVAK
jgi:hypothetical protein